MPSLRKSLLLATLPLALFTLPSCQTTPAPGSSVIEETADMVERTTCADLQLPVIDEAEFNSASQYWRDLIVEMDAAWWTRCGGN